LKANARCDKCFMSRAGFCERNISIAFQTTVPQTELWFVPTLESAVILSLKFLKCSAMFRHLEVPSSSSSSGSSNFL